MHPRSIFGDQPSRPLLQRLGVVAASILAGVLACGALLAVLSGPVSAAPAAGSVNYPGSAPCNTTLQACIDGSVTGTTIVVQAGTYFTNALTLGRPVSLTGQLSSTTILHALASQRVLTVTGAAVNSSVIISGLTFAGGHAVGGGCPDGCGGAILITGTAQPLLINLTISNSQADNNGGGLYASTGRPLVMSAVAVLSSTSVSDGGGAWAQGNVTLNGGSFQNNQCTGANCNGGGLFVGGDLTAADTQFLSNTSIGGSFEGDVGGGGGALVSQTVTLNGGLFQNNQCTAVTCAGGGLFANTGVTLTGTEFLSNTSISGGGALTANDDLTATDALFLNNTSLSDGGAANVSNVTLNRGVFQNNTCTDPGGCSGGGLRAGNGIFTGTKFLGNAATGGGGGAFASGNLTLNGGLFQNNQCNVRFNCNGAALFAGADLTAANTQFLSNTSISDGGAVWGIGNITVNGGLFQNNQCTGASCQGGGLWAGNTLALTDTLFLSNTAQRGGGLYHWQGDGRLVNDLFAANQAGGQGNALYLASPGSVTLLFTTIASPTLGSGAAIAVAGSTVGITDTIVASYTTGINLTAGSVFQDYNLFFGNGTNTAGAVSGGTHNASGNPLFVNPASNDYHLRLGSAAVDAGINAGVTTDVDGDPRPQGAGFDIGYDELDFATVGVTKSASASLLAPGQLLTYTLVYSNAGPGPATGVRLTDIVPLNLTNLNVTSSGAALTATGGLTYAWQVADLPPGAGGTITLTGVLASHARGTVFTNTAAITTTTVETNTSRNTSAVSVTVANVPPVAADDAYTVTGNTTLTVTAPGVLSNDTDANNDPLTAVLAAPPFTGTLNLHPDGSFTYTPPHGFAGVVTFTYRANDGLADSNTATVTITVTAAVYKLYLPLVRR